MQIKTYKGKRIESPHFFFILNKGNNSGKPLAQPCANCYVLIAETKKEKDFYYWLCYGLWQSNKFHPFLYGSVIPFLRVHNIKIVLKTGSNHIKLSDIGQANPNITKQRTTNIKTQILTNINTCS